MPSRSEELGALGCRVMFAVLKRMVRIELTEKVEPEQKKHKGGEGIYVDA